jgi:hypothetical protein
LKNKEIPKRNKPPLPRELSPRQMFSTRHLPGGSPTFDKIFPCALGFAIGTAIGLFLIQGNPEQLKFSTGGIGHPLFKGAIYGICIGLLVSPVALWITKGRDNNKGILPVTVVLGLVAGLFIGS